MDAVTKDRLIFAATVAGTAIAILALGYTVGKDTNEATASFLREKYSELEKREQAIRAEHSALRIEVEQLRGPTTGSTNVPGGVGKVARSTNQGNYPSESESKEVDLRAGATERVFDGSLILSMTESSYEGNPLRYKITATLGAPGTDSLVLDKVDVGYRVEYKDYEIRVIAVGSGAAKFLVQRSRKSEASQETPPK